MAIYASTSRSRAWKARRSAARRSYALESQAVAALDVRGLPVAKIYRLYPDVSHEAIDEALDLEAQLRRNLQPLAA